MVTEAVTGIVHVSKSWIILVLTGEHGIENEAAQWTGPLGPGYLDSNPGPAAALCVTLSKLN